ncbi:MAG: single-stranded DNA-binding protein [Thiothrix sp.]|jgi:single-strand DNA-binding protein|uniref:single-stranded DNA-binding protein n=1 Tax=Thiothrix sp. TaxID=1032 RepID=UPI00262A1818|nr:single-stranded DNA-binding protein [Thiothrix sp.]MDD5395370.1 single-stranded DNA-binding protein [Thiothrix sp.]
MGNRFEGRGNLGNDPVLKFVEVAGGEKRAVCELRVYFDRQVKDGDNWKEQGGFWLNVSYWGKRGEQAGKLLVKGCRVSVVGMLVQESWADKETGEEKSRLVLEADSVDLDLLRVESVRFVEKQAA